MSGRLAGLTGSSLDGRDWSLIGSGTPTVIATTGPGRLLVSVGSLTLGLAHSMDSQRMDRRFTRWPSTQTTRSEELYAAAQEVIAGGVNSGARGPEAGWVPGPPVVARGSGAYVWDVDGNRYLDYLLALGPMVHGHAHPVITAAV